jgi:hypothetical protein
LLLAIHAEFIVQGEPFHLQDNQPYLDLGNLVTLAKICNQIHEIAYAPRLI